MAAATLAALGSHASAVEILIPSYFYPSGSNNGWPQLNTAASSVAITAILNPDSGPGVSLDTNYRNAVNSLRASGGRVIGYVSTSYAERPIADVKADIAKYKSLYSIDGIFLDEMTNTNDPTALGYYRELYSYIKTLDPDWRVTANPGTNTQPAYLGSPRTADTLVTFENDSGYASANPSAWTVNYGTRRFTNLPYAVASSATMVQYVNAAAGAKRAGYLYVTDDSGANPWDRLPTYWSAELDAIRAVTPTWNVNASGDWMTASSWATPAVPNGMGAEAYLMGAIASPQTIYTNTNLTLGTLVVNSANRYDLTGGGTLTMDASVENATIDVRRGSHTINVPLLLHDTTDVFIAGGATLTIADPLVMQAGTSLVKSGAGTLSILSTVSEAASLSITAGEVSASGDMAVASLHLAGDGAFVLAKDATLIVRRQPIEQIRSSLRDAYVAEWEGRGLRVDGADKSRGVGFTVDADGVVTLRLTNNGDADVDGDIDFTDLLAVAKSYGRAERAIWTDGDFDYDGKVGLSDVAMLRQNYGAADRFEADWSLAQSLVPEPGSLTLLAGVALLRRRHP